MVELKIGDTVLWPDTTVSVFIGQIIGVSVDAGGGYKTAPYMVKWKGIDKIQHYPVTSLIKIEPDGLLALIYG